MAYVSKSADTRLHTVFERYQPLWMVNGDLRRKKMFICQSPLLLIRVTGDHKSWKSRLSPKPDGSTYVDTLQQERDGLETTYEIYAIRDLQS